MTRNHQELVLRNDPVLTPKQIPSSSDLITAETSSSRPQRSVMLILDASLTSEQTVDVDLSSLCLLDTDMA